jgi:pimeloyl-ACP methyl ester carboxylesterase/class 3 adenylate cyclase
MIPKTHYTSVGGISIAYQVLGNGPVDLVMVPGWLSNIEVFWEEPRVRRFLEQLASFARLILFDKRGTGLSDRVVEVATLEQRMEDVRAVMDAVGSRKAALFGYSEGGAMCALFAATYPARVHRIILAGCFARRVSAPDYPIGPSREQALATLDDMMKGWGGPVGMEARMPSVAHDRAAQEWWSKYLRMSASPSAARALSIANFDIDIRAVLPTIQTPALVLHMDGDQVVPMDAARALAAAIPNARLVTIKSIDHVPFFEAAAEVVQHIEEFVTGARHDVIRESSLQTILFCDVVGSTRLAAEKGDQQWTDQLEAYYKTVRTELAVYRGLEVNTAGDGFVASFDGPARAIHCASAISESVKRIGLNVRVGLHTGECERRNGQLSGLALHIAARVAAIATADRVLISQTVRDLVAGSGLRFSDAGSHVLKGVPETWRIFQLAA